MLRPQNTGQILGRSLSLRCFRRAQVHSGDDVKPVSVGIVGLGTVGGGAFNLLRENAAEISRRTGRDIRVSHVGMRRDKPGYDLSGTQVSQDIFAVVNDPELISWSR
jgi:hypothetical protein